MATPLNIDRVTKLIVLLSSDKDGEVLAAVRALDKMLKNADQTWHDLAARIGNGVQKPTVNSYEKNKGSSYYTHDKPKPNSKRYTTSENRFKDLLRSKLTPWETEFVNSVYAQWKRKGSFSERQSDVLRDIFERVKHRA